MGMMKAVLGTALWVSWCSFLDCDVDFQKEVWPILRENCIKCHQPKEERGRLKAPKAKLRLDSAVGIIRGGESGPSVVPGKPQQSSLYTLTVLAPDHDDIMPPKGKPLSRDQTDVLRRWIEQGASFGSWQGSEPLEGQTWPKGHDRLPQYHQFIKNLEKDLLPLSEQDVATLQKVGFQVLPVYESSKLLEVTFRHPASIKNHWSTFMSYASRVVRLELHGLQCSPKHLKDLRQLPHLRQLLLKDVHLSQDQLNDLRSWTQSKGIQLLTP